MSHINSATKYRESNKYVNFYHIINFFGFILHVYVHRHVSNNKNCIPTPFASILSAAPFISSDVRVNFMSSQELSQSWELYTQLHIHKIQPCSPPNITLLKSEKAMFSVTIQLFTNEPNSYREVLNFPVNTDIIFLPKSITSFTKEQAIEKNYGG